MARILRPLYKPYALKHRKIIVIEDDEAVNEGLAMMLRKSDYEVESFLTVDAFDKALTGPPDIYLVDRQLRGADGLGLCSRLKSNEATRHVPVIIMSASPDTERHLQEAGGDAFLDKPFSKKTILALLDSVLSRYPAF